MNLIKEIKARLEKNGENKSIHIEALVENLKYNVFNELTNLVVLKITEEISKELLPHVKEKILGDEKQFEKIINEIRMMIAKNYLYN